MEVSSHAEYAEFGDKAEIAAMLFLRADVSRASGAHAADGAIGYILRESFSVAEFDRLLAILTEKETALAALAAAEAAEARIEERRGCIGRLFALFSPAKETEEPIFPTRRPDYAAVRKLLEAARNARENDEFEERVNDAFAAYDEDMARRIREIGERN